MSATSPSWLSYAQADLDSAKTLTQTTAPPWHLICYLCQQSAEKNLKAFLLLHGWQLQKTHDVVKLLEQAKYFDSALSVLDSDADLLNTYVHAGRYPLIVLTATDGTKAIAAAEKVRHEILSRLGSKSI